jgi:hypothetical protein
MKSENQAKAGFCPDPYLVMPELRIPPEWVAASEACKLAISKMPRLSDEEYIAQARKMLGREGYKPYQSQSLESGGAIENVDKGKPS